MLINIRHFLDRANYLLMEGSDDALRHAALELRRAFETVAYYKLERRLGRAPMSEMKGWQPAAIIERLVDICDDALPVGARLSIGDSRPDASDKSQYTELGQMAALDPKKFKKLYNILGGLLHESISKEGVHDPSPGLEKNRIRVHEALEFIEEAASGTLEFVFGMIQKFNCELCGTLIERTHSKLEEGQSVRCSKPGCKASYSVVFNGDDRIFRSEFLVFDCPRCARQSYAWYRELEESDIRKGLEKTCIDCGKTVLLRWQIQIKHEPENQD